MNIPGLYGELVWFVGDSALQSWTVDTDTSRIAALGDSDSEWAVGHRGAVIANLHTVRA